jgi:hypothetical protein
VQPPIPGSTECFFDEILKFIRTNAQGDVRSMILTETSTGQFWVNGQVGNRTWVMGMINMGLKTIETMYMIDLMERHEQNQEDLKEQQLRAMKPEGKPQ